MCSKEQSIFLTNEFLSVEWLKQMEQLQNADGMVKMMVSLTLHKQQCQQWLASGYVGTCIHGAVNHVCYHFTST